MDKKHLPLLFALLILLTGTMVLICLYPVTGESDTSAARIETLYRWRMQMYDLLRSGENENARLMAVRILHSVPGDAAALRVSARVCHDAGNYAAAEKIYRDVLYADPEDAVARNNLALLLIRSGQIENGFSELLVARQLMPDNPVIEYNVRQAAAALKKNGYPAPGEAPDISDQPDILYILDSAANETTAR